MKNIFYATLLLSLSCALANQSAHAAYVHCSCVTNAGAIVGEVKIDCPWGHFLQDKVYHEVCDNTYPGYSWNYDPILFCSDEGFCAG